MAERRQRRLPRLSIVDAATMRVWAKRLGAPGAALLAALCVFRNRRSGLCCPSVQSLAPLVGVSERQVQRLVAAAEAAGLLVVERHGFRNSNSYRIVPGNADDEVASDDIHVATSPSESDDIRVVTSSEGVTTSASRESRHPRRESDDIGVAPTCNTEGTPKRNTSAPRARGLLSRLTDDEREALHKLARVAGLDIVAEAGRCAATMAERGEQVRAPGRLLRAWLQAEAGERGGRGRRPRGGRGALPAIAEPPTERDEGAHYCKLDGAPP